MKKTIFGKVGILFFSASLLLAGTRMVNAASNDSSDNQSGPQKSASIHLQLAIEFYKVEKYKDALQEVKRSLNSASDYAPAYSMGGLIYMQMGETQAASESFQKAMSLDRNNGDYINNYGWFLCQNNQVEESLQYFERAASMRSYTTPGKAYDNAGMCSLKLKDNAAAEKYFTQAYRVEPGNPRVNYNLAILYFARSDYENARFHVKLAVRAGASTPEVLWLGIKIAHKMSDSMTEGEYASTLQRSYHDSKEYSAYQREAFDE